MWESLTELSWKRRALTFPTKSRVNLSRKAYDVFPGFFWKSKSSYFQETSSKFQGGNITCLKVFTALALIINLGQKLDTIYIFMWRSRQRSDAHFSQNIVHVMKEQNHYASHKDMKKLCHHKKKHVQSQQYRQEN